MRYIALACDYDGTLAHHGQVEEQTLDALERVRGSGRRLILVTGRILEDLLAVFPRLDLFERVVAENGALLYRPASREEKPLGDPPPPRLVQALHERGVAPLGVGRVIVATSLPHETTAFEVIRDLKLELQVIFNKGAVMVLPSGVNKATGLNAALAELALSPHNAVGIGDAENDHAFLSLCECSAAVADALPSIKERVCLVTQNDNGAGVVELIDRLIASDLREIQAGMDRYAVLLGVTPEGHQVHLKPYGANVLLAGPSGSGKSTVAAAILERLTEHKYQFCIIDPEGDYSNLEGAVVLGDNQHQPAAAELLSVLEKPQENAVVNLLGVKIEDRPAYFQTLLPRLQELRARTGRPHWLILDEAHHLLPSSWDPSTATLLQDWTGMMMITVHPDHISPAALSPVDTVIVVGEAPERTLRDFTKTVGQRLPSPVPQKVEPGEAIAWTRRPASAPFLFRIAPPRAERRRHHRKYAEGDLGLDKSFYFRGPEGKLNLRAHNLALFMRLAEGVDDETWLHHLKQGDYSRWFREAIKDEELAAEAERVESQPDLSPADSRAHILSHIERRYTKAA